MTARLVSARYRVGELLGSGGSASVFAAVDVDSGETVALKILHPHLAGVAATRDAFFREASAAGILQHPNIAGVLGTGVDSTDTDPLAWIAFEFAPGMSLAEYVETTGPLSVPNALTVVGAILDALVAAHALGIVHRDISPSNVSVSVSVAGSAGPGSALQASGVRLLDFGLADAVGRAAIGADLLRTTSSDAPAGVLGNVNYLSPEQAMGHPVDERGDLYQAAGVLYFALTGRAPFVRASVESVMRAHLDALPPVPSVSVAGIPRALDRLVVKGMLKDPSSRFASAVEMRAEVSRVLASSSAGAGTARTVTAVAVAASAAAATAASTAVAVAATPATLTIGRSIPAAPVYAMSPEAVRARRGLAAWVAIVSMVGAVAIGAVVVGATGHVPAGAGGAVAISTVPSTNHPAPSATAVSPAQLANQPGTSVPVPDVTGVDLSTVRANLAAAGLIEGGLEVEDSLAPADTVLGISPSPGASVSAGDAVTLRVASGYNVVPDLVGMAAEVGIGTVTSAGFLAAVTTVGVQDSTGSVAHTVPVAGSSVPLGSTIEIVLQPAASTPVTTTTPTPRPTVKPTTEPTATPTPTATSAPTAVPTPSATPTPSPTPAVDASATSNG